MPTPRSCVRCSSPLPDPLPGDVCPVCGSKVGPTDIPLSTSLAPKTPLPDTPSFSFRPPADPDAPTATPTAAPEPEDFAVTAVADSARRTGRPPTLTGYEVGKVLGAGGMGVVYEAVQTRAGRVVALKVVRNHSLLDGPQRVRFDSEAKALGQLAHPNIVTVYEVGEEDGTPFFSMEHVGGGSLAHRVRDGKRVDPADAARMIADVAAAVGAAHEKGILHRDLKPSNVLVTADGTPKVADFGLAKWLDHDGPTHTGGVVGTPSYMAPEQVDPKFGPVGPAADVYGLGATLYHLLTGRPPFKAETPVGTAQQVASTEPPAVRDVCPDVCPTLDAIVRKAMAKATADRYPSTAALAADLTAWRLGKSPSVRPLTRGERLRRWGRRHRVKLAAAAVVLAVAAAAVIAKREADPKRQLERALDRGEAVTLIGETGPPRWMNWELGASTPDPTLSGDGSFAFQTQTQTLLELCPDPRHDRYRLSAEVRHLGAKWDASVAGVYVGCPGGGVAGDIVVRRLVAVMFDDFVRVVDKKIRQAAREHGLEIKDYIYVRTATDVTVPPVDVGTLPDSRLGKWTGQSPWRRIVIEVAPEGLEVYWEVEPAPGGRKTLARVVTLPAGEFEPRARIRHPDLVAKFGDPFPAAPAWGPRGPVGLIVRDSSAAFRNVVLTPNPAPLPE